MNNSQLFLENNIFSLWYEKTLEYIRVSWFLWIAWMTESGLKKLVVWATAWICSFAILETPLGIKILKGVPYLFQCWFNGVPDRRPLHQFFWILKYILLKLIGRQWDVFFLMKKLYFQLGVNFKIKRYSIENIFV